MHSRVQVLDQISGQILFECPIEEMDLAYKKAHEYEEMGLDIKIQAPGITETLIKSLGASEADIAKLKQELIDELEGHNEEIGELGCSICPPKKN
jgi:predicted amino acid-binding ACT domain protein